MSSRAATTDDEPTDDRTTKARIRDAAIGCIAELGVADTTARRVAEAAGVSPGLVIHHYGSMDGLRAACNDHVAAVIRRQKLHAMSAGTGLDVLGALRNSEVGSLGGYLAQVLVEDSPVVVKLVDDLVADAEVYLQQGVEAGSVRPSTNQRGRAAVVALWSLGALVLHRHLERILGVDLTDPNVGVDGSIAAYVGPASEILGAGILTADFASHLEQSFAGAVEEDEHPEPATTTTDTKPTAQAESEGTL
jgi:AcrR family transcriptional regulator